MTTVSKKAKLLHQQSLKAILISLLSDAANLHGRLGCTNSGGSTKKSGSRRPGWNERQQLSEWLARLRF